MTTAGEGIVVGDLVQVAGEIEVGGHGVGTGVIVVPGGPGGGVSEADLEQLRTEVGGAVSSLQGQIGGVISAVTALANRPRDYLHTQATASGLWLIWHPLPDLPDVRVTGLDGRRLYPQRQLYPAPGQLRLDFTRPVAGTAYLS